MLLVFDTETTGYKGGPPPHQTFIIQAGQAIFTPEGSNTHRSVFLRRDVIIPPESTAIHGITTSLCNQAGFPISWLWPIFKGLADTCDTFVGYNIQFDIKMWRTEAERLGTSFVFNSTIIDLMPICTPICKIPFPNSSKPGNYKWPTLTEAATEILGKAPSAAHDALADVHTTSKLYFTLKAQGKL